MKRVLECGILCIMLASIVGCGKEKPVSEDEIKQTVLQNDSLYSEYAEAGEEFDEVSFSIDDRRTDSENGTDVITCELNYSNDDFSYETAYEVSYHYYDQGWKLEHAYQTGYDLEILSEPELDDATADEIAAEEGWAYCTPLSVNMGYSDASIEAYGVETEEYCDRAVICEIEYEFDSSPNVGWYYTGYYVTGGGWTTLREDAFLGSWSLITNQYSLVEGEVYLEITAIDFTNNTISYNISGNWSDIAVTEEEQDFEPIDFGTGISGEGTLTTYEFDNHTYDRVDITDQACILLNSKGVVFGYGSHDLSYGGTTYDENVPYCSTMTKTSN